MVSKVKSVWKEAGSALNSQKEEIERENRFWSKVLKIKVKKYKIPIWKYQKEKKQKYTKKIIIKL